MPVKLRYFLSGECSSFSPALTCRTHRLGVIFRHTLAAGVHQTEVVLGVGVPLIGQRFPFFQCGLKVIGLSGL